MNRTDRIAGLFRAKRYHWISVYRLANVGGFSGWRTRLSEARRWYRMPIENRQVRQKNGVVRSEYRLGRRKAA